MSTVKFRIYLYSPCRRSSQEGVITMTSPKGTEEKHFNYLDEIPSRIRELLLGNNLVFDVNEDPEGLAETVIVERKRRTRLKKSTEI